MPVQVRILSPPPFFVQRHKICGNRESEEGDHGEETETEMTKARVLILNASWEPHSIVRDRRAVNLLLGDDDGPKIEMVEHSGDYYRSQYIDIPVPSVARLKTYVEMPASFRKSVLLKTSAVLKRDGFICGYCGGVATTMDHITPRGKGGPHSWKNVTASCWPCNNLKRDLELHEMIAMGPDKPNVPGAIEAWNERWTLTRKPFVPTGVQAYLLTIRAEDAWEPYLQVA
jgi:5-methylcytosine-specific restriction endonuclease McrA